MSLVSATAKGRRIAAVQSVPARRFPRRRHYQGPADERDHGQVRQKRKARWSQSEDGDGDAVTGRHVEQVLRGLRCPPRT